MVTAIAVPIICLYFYWVTKKEFKAHHQQWLNLNQVEEEAIITGKIIDIYIEKQRFYYYRFIWIVEVKLQTNTNVVNIKKHIPHTKEVILPNLEVGNLVRFYGNWKQGHFEFNRFSELPNA